MDYNPTNLYDAYQKYFQTTYSAEELKSDVIPFGIDAANLEVFFFSFSSSFLLLMCNFSLKLRCI